MTQVNRARSYIGTLRADIHTDSMDVVGLAAGFAFSY